MRVLSVPRQSVVFCLAISVVLALSGSGLSAASGGGAGGPGELVVGTATLVSRSESLPYSYAYFVPASAQGAIGIPIVAVAIPGWREASYAGAELYALDEVNTLARVAQTSSSGAFSASFVALSVAVPMPEGDVAYPGDPGSGSVGYARMLEASNFLGTEVDSFYYRPDLKFIAALEDLQRRLSASGITAAKRILLMGFSAGGGWASRFPVLHPDLVAASVVVASYVLTMPIEECAGSPQPYPLGIYDLDRLGVGQFDLDSYRGIAFLIVAGTREPPSIHKGDLLPASAATYDQVCAYIDAYGASPAQQAASFAGQLHSMGMRCDLLVGRWGHEFPWAARAQALAFLLSIPVG